LIGQEGARVRQKEMFNTISPSSKAGSTPALSILGTISPKEVEKVVAAFPSLKHPTRKSWWVS